MNGHVVCSMKSAMIRTQSWESDVSREHEEEVILSYVIIKINLKKRRKREERGDCMCILYRAGGTVQRGV